MKKLLIVIDYQKDFVDGSLGFKGAEALEDGICEAIENATDVVFTFDTHTNEYLNTMEGKKLPVMHCLKDSDGFKLYGKVANYLDKAIKVFEKPSFGSLELAEWIKDKDYDEIELCGLVSNICVVSNAVLVKAACPNTKIVVNKNLTSSFDEEGNEAALKVLESIHIDIIQ